MIKIIVNNSKQQIFEDGWSIIYSLSPKMTDTRIKEVKQIGAQKMRRDMYRDV
jgi:hypothetical protein